MMKYLILAISLIVIFIPITPVKPNNPHTQLSNIPLVETILPIEQTYVETIEVKPISPVDYVRAEAKKYGWDTGYQWDSLYTLIQNESGWRPYVYNSSSSACGLFQSLPCAKLGAPLEDVANQARWGLAYISNRYTTPSGALSSWKSRCGSRLGCWY